MDSDPLNIVPDSSNANVAYCICLTFVSLMMMSALWIHFKAYDTHYVPTSATITEADCNRFSINNHENEYHCTIEIVYSDPSGSGDTHKNSLHFVDNERFYKGDKLRILVDRDNPLKIKTQVISDETFACFCCLTALLILVIATGVRFVRIA